MSKNPAVAWVVAAGAALMIVGAFGPWFRAIILVSVSGTDGGDGWIIVGLGVLGLSSAYVISQSNMSRARNLAAVIALLAGLAGIGVFGYDGSGVFGTQADPGNVLFGNTDLLRPGWGLFMVGVGSVVLALSSGYALVSGSRLARGEASAR